MSMHLAKIQFQLACVFDNDDIHSTKANGVSPFGVGGQNAPEAAAAAVIMVKQHG